ncbi:class I SAM-dependent methyltransferase [Stappia sp. F7233]|uniref:Class I SAM-dependent methyltransferase n=1 Tax=Stappia albiluteola TaxID=2758565 RepID=A0A839AFB6_9HYPH|nr:class I SAM-dependent methyltransferase [Stappia albiluteola]MBA5778540.1 class I SAM-dependent methyltransferase [Stappia albiluteola]
MGIVTIRKGGKRISLKKRIEGVLTLLGLANRGFYIPYRYAGSIQDVPPAYDAIEEHFAGLRADFQHLLGRIEADSSELASAAANALGDHWTRGYFGALDTSATWAVVRQGRPRRVIEVGSGSSTHVLSAASAGLSVRPEITCIDPVPRADISALGVRWVEAVLGEGHVELFRRLEAGDVAFFDSSHILFQGTDVDIIFNRILPALKPGVLVHFHDIFLPDPYPLSWSHRAYTEQSGLAGWLYACDVVFSSHYAGTRMADEVAAAMGALPAGERTGASIWLRTKGR